MLLTAVQSCDNTASITQCKLGMISLTEDKYLGVARRFWTFTDVRVVSVRDALSSEELVLGLGVENGQLEKPSNSKAIAIVGAGSAGLAALKALLDVPYEIREGWNIVLFEERRNVSGIWLPDLNDPHPPVLPETPLYPSLKTNTPHPTMTYLHFPFPPKTPVFPSHDYISRYHYDFAHSFDLLRFIQFNTSVVRSAWIGNSSVGQWNVTTVDKNTGIQRHQLFDHLISANGHYRYPNIPTWPGQDDWLGANQDREILHSMYWRNGTKYTGKTVLVIGGRASGRDVVLNTAPHAEKVYLSVRSGILPTRLNASYVPKPGISHFTSDSVVFVDGTEESGIDAVVLGTGYELRVPFLTAGGALDVSPGANTSEDHPAQLTTNLQYIYPLHEHVFSLAESYPPTALSFIGLNVLVPNCPTDFAQALLVSHAIANPSLLSSRSEMLARLRAREAHCRECGYDPFKIGHRIEDIDGFGNASYVYEEGLVDFLKERGAIPDDGKPYVEEWRRLKFEEYETLWLAWQRVESLGARETDKWLDGVETEEEWADLMHRLIDWQRDHDKALYEIVNSSD
ncbi:hypothetical protein ACEPAI_2020 [Sanghuangporus weigelae]